jgi:hypothetical protein
MISTQVTLCDLKLPDTTCIWQEVEDHLWENTEDIPKIERRK